MAAGSASISQSGNRMDVNQASERAVINWNSFNIQSHEHVNFNQPGRDSAVLNRITGNDPSAIAGKLTANGHVYLVNPNGILFDKTAQINVGGLIASTANISNANFMAGRLNFDQPGRPGALISNAGNISVQQGGLVALVAPGVENQGVIQARLGKVTLAAGDAFTLDLYGDRLINLTVSKEQLGQITDAQGKPLTHYVGNRGEIIADGGIIALLASTGKHIVDNQINLQGHMQARSVENRNGVITLVGDENTKVSVSGTVDVSGQSPNSDGGKVEVRAGTVALNDGTHIDASGDRNGGTVLVGGDYQGQGAAPNAQTTSVSGKVRIQADSRSEGSGGKVIVWADDHTRFDGSISAKGGSRGGDGGLAEVSGKKHLNYTGRVSLDAPHGRAGTLLLDPEDITVADSGSSTLTGDPATISASTISTTLGSGTNVLLKATRNIDVLARIDARFDNAPSGAGLDLTAGNDINIGAAILTKNGAISATATNGQITMADNSFLFAGNQNITLRAGGDISTQQLVTTGDVTLSSSRGSVTQLQDLGGIPGFSLGRILVDANGGYVKLKGLLSTGDIQVTALRNIDIDRPIDSGGSVLLASSGNNLDRSAINLNHNVYTHGGNITFAGDVLLNPQAGELHVPITAKTPGYQGSFDTCATSVCAQELCPTCNVITNNNEQVLVLDTLFKQFIFANSGNIVGATYQPTNFNLRLQKNGTTITGYDGTNLDKTLADQRVAGLASLFEVRQITVNSNGGNITFAGKLDRYAADARENFSKAYAVNYDDPTVTTNTATRMQDFDVVFDSFVNHGLELSANSGGIEFKGQIGDKNILALSLYRDQHAVDGDKIGFQGFFDLNNSGGNGDTPIIPVIGTFNLALTTRGQIRFEKDIFINTLTVNGTNQTSTDAQNRGADNDSKIQLVPDGLTGFIALNANTIYGATTASLAAAGFSPGQIGGAISLGDSPGTLTFANTGGNTIGQLQGAVASAGLTTRVQPQAEVAWRTVKCKGSRTLAQRDGAAGQDRNGGDGLYVIEAPNQPAAAVRKGPDGQKPTAGSGATDCPA
ncbi:filamentous hemagglutinin N-terminal domain-containing protein [Methylococcus sp. EFPC2]|nr:filamentous hemagglutinin N-terminal domain-containing protein [Methylococcus sp. EFPC2]